MKNKFKVTLRVTPVYQSNRLFQKLLLIFIDGWLDKEYRYKTGYSYFEFSPPKLVKASNSEKVNDYCISYMADTIYSSHIFFIKKCKIL